jgi:hypothetical protein
LEPAISTPITLLDESYGHQVVAPAATTAHQHPAWAERCYHLLHVGGPWVLGAGRAVWPHAGRRTAFAGIANGKVLHALRVAEPFALGEDPNRPDVGPLRIEPVRALREVRLVLDDPAFPVSFDLVYTGRFPPVATEPNLIERDGEVVTEYMNFFQSGRYSGTVVVDGREHQVRDRAGFRDRGWGLRKHEGSPRRGLVVFCGCELPDAALYLLLYETASAKRVFTNGWLIDERGLADTVAGAEHELHWDQKLLTGGTIEVQLASGGRRLLEFEVEGRLYLSTVGYTADEARAAPGADRFDLTDPVVVADLNGQNDNGCRFSLDGAEGHGYVETGLGTHAHYKPEPAASR